MASLFKSKFFAFIACVGITLATSARAETKKPHSLADDLSIAYYGVYYGPSPPHVETTAASFNTGDNSPQFIDNALITGYKFNDKFSLGPVFAFAIQTFGLGANDRTFILEDLYLRVRFARIVENGPFRMDADFRIYVPTSKSAHLVGMISGIRANQLSTYAIPNSRFTVGHYSYIRSYFTQGYSTEFLAETGADKIHNAGLYSDLELNLSVYGSYQFAPKVAATLWSDVLNAYRHQRNQPWDLDHFVRDGWDLEPGLNFDFTPNLSWNPYINFYPANPTLDRTTFNFILSAKFL